MRKHIFHLFGALLFVLPISFIACDKIGSEEIHHESDSVNLSSDALFFEGNVDSVALVVGSSGQWTISDNPDWLAVSPTNGVNGDSLFISVSKNETITERNAQLILQCGTASDTLEITQYGYIETDYVNLKLDGKDVAYQYDVATGSMSVTYPQGTLPVLKSGSAIVMPAEYDYDIRVVESYSVSGNTLSVQTSEGNMTNLFRNISFTLATNPSTVTRSVDGRRVFTPSSCGYVDADGEYHELYNADTRASITVGERLWTFSKDYSGDKLYEGGAGEVVWDKCCFDAALDGEFSFDFGEVVLDEWSSLGELQRFSYKLIGSLGLDMLLRYHYENAYEEEEDAILKKKVVPTLKYTFMVGAVPVVITVDTNLGGYGSFGAKGELDISTGVKYDSELNIGLEWTPDAGVTPINKGVSSLSVYPLTIEARASMESKVSYYPQIEIGIYKFVGPWVEPRPYLKTSAEAGLRASTDGENYIGWTSVIYSGMDLGMGLGLNFGIWDYEFWKPDVVNIIEDDTLCAGPSRIRRLSPKDSLEVNKGDVIDAEFIVEYYSPVTGGYYPCPHALVNLEAECGELSANVAVADDEGKVRVQWTPSPDESVATRSAEKIGSKLTAEVVDALGEVIGTATLCVMAEKKGLCPNHNHPHMIDLGLPSGTKWACCNVDATSPEDYGGYYAWGETETKEDYSWRTYKWCNGSSSNITKYCLEHFSGFLGSPPGFSDGNTTLDAEDDVAQVWWGSAWHMPSTGEYLELQDECKWEWTSVNGVNGYKVIGPNGNSIFLPAAGCRYGKILEDSGLYGRYWTMDLYLIANEDARHLSFDEGFYDCIYTVGDRSCGYTIRPVAE